MDEINRKQKKNEKSLMQIYPDFNSFLFAFGFGDYKEKNTPTLFSLINLNYEIPCQILESFYNKYKFSPISSTTFMDEKVSLVALTKLEPKTWLSDITIDAFYYLLNKYEKVKNIPAEESAYFVDSVFMHGPHSEILYNTVQNLNLKNIEDKENISAIESTINVWFELFNKKGSKTVYNILKKIVLKKLNYKYMVFPTVVGTDHFSVIVLEKETDLSDETRVVYSIRNFDSLPSKRIDKQIIEFTKLKCIEMFFNKLHKECNPYLDVSFEIINADIQTQFNGYDCGIFTCMKAMEYFEKKKGKILDQADAYEFRKEIFCMLVNYIMTQLEEEEEKNAKVLSEDAVKLLDNIKTTEEKTANVVINPEAIIKITTDKITAGTEVRHNNFQKAIESFMTIEAVRANLKVVNEDNFTNLCCKEFIESFENKPTSQPFWLFLREMFINLTNEIEAYFKSDKIQKVLNETYIERLSNSDLSNNIGFVEKVFVKTGSSMDIETKVSDTVSPTKQFLDFPDSIYNDPITIFDEIQNKYEDVNLVSSALMSIKDAAPEGVVDNRKESAPVYMKKYNINEKQKSLKKKVYLLSFRVFEGIAVQYLDKKEAYDLDTKKCLNIIKGYSRINPDTNIDYFSAFVLAAFEHINYDPNRNEYIKVLLHLVTEKKEKASVKVETIMNIKKLIKEVDKTSLDELVDKYAKMRLRTPKEKVSYKGTSSSSSVSKRKKKQKIINHLQKKLKQVKQLRIKIKNKQMKQLRIKIKNKQVMQLRIKIKNKQQVKQLRINIKNLLLLLFLRKQQVPLLLAMMN